ncbi:hypothetical protein [Novosphingobium sp. FSW06-99]|uniref:hypothetical protein n=1 Tax=Novosphingobium sp. FSW06-99 TaxID=1739113 RepID=UPI00076BD9A5|nr:hypothetical protein [Novosphingobium sp. FSW06-99]KUR80742.1 hypothetical protein AQZ49_01560 [Novosphingobium sp. FSW06-99]
MKLIRCLAALLALVCWTPLLAQTAQAPTYQKGNQVTTADGIFVVDKNGNPFGTSSNPLNVTGTNVVTSLPTLPAGSNVIGGVTISGTPSVAQSGTWSTGRTWSLSSSTDTVTASISGTPSVAQSGTWNFNCTSGCSGGGGGTAVQGSGSSSNPWYWLPASGANTALESGGNLAAAVSQLTSANSALTSANATLSSQLAAVQTVAGSVTAPINAQTTHQVLIGAVEGATAAGTASPYPLTIQGSASGVAVPIGPTTVAANTSGSVNIVQGSASVAISATTSGTVQLVALASGKSIYVTHIHVIAGSSAGFALIYGTGTNCGTGTAYLDGASGNTMAFTANSGYSAGVGLGPVYVVPSGNALCAVFSTAANYAGSLTYSQF